jgi:6-phospho-beta-glucosidase
VQTRRVTIIGGGGVRTPLLVHGLAQAKEALPIDELAIFDLDREHAETIARLGREIVRRRGASFDIKVYPSLESAADHAAFVINCVRVGGMEGRARDERLAIEHGLAGQETTGPGGAAMALRTIPVTLAHARIVEQAAPEAWFINFTNPAGLITQALTQHTKLRAIGICDTPAELFFGIARALGEPLEDCQFDYAGLNHLGWVRHVRLRGEDITARVLDDAELLRHCYPAGLFDPQLIRTLRLIPTEYLFFYYSQRRAHDNQLRAGASRGEELAQMNHALFAQLRDENPVQALETYRAYLAQRNASYLKLEAEGGSAFAYASDPGDPFNAATGYHRIAIDVMTGLVSGQAREIVLNVPNRGAIEDLDADDVVEVPCELDRSGARPHRTGHLPPSVRGLVESVKEYERTLLRAAVSGSGLLAQMAMMQCPIVADWELAGRLTRALAARDAQHLGYLRF